MVGSARAIAAFAACALTTPLTDRITVAVCVVPVPVIAVTVTRSPPTSQSNGNSSGYVA